MFWFSGFRLDPRQRRLLGPDGNEIALRPKVFDTLTVLVANAGKLIDKTEIFEQVWPGVVVEENNLNQAISTLRRELGDSRKAPRFIATVTGRGYRFVAPVRSVEADDVSLSVGLGPEAPVEAQAIPVSRRRFGINAQRLAAVTLIVLAAAWVGTVVISGSDAPAPTADEIARAVVSEFAGEPGVAGNSPDWASTNDAEAQLIFERAKALLDADGPEYLATAEELFREAMARDPDFLLAHIGLWETLNRVANLFPERIDDDWTRDVESLIERMIELAPTSAFGYALRADQFRGRGDLLGARRAVEEGLERLQLADSSEQLRLERKLIGMGMSTGSMSAAVEQNRAALDANPLSLLTSWRLQWILHATGDLEGAEALYEDSLELAGDRLTVEFLAYMRALTEGFDMDIVEERQARYRQALVSASKPEITFPLELKDDSDAALAELRRHLRLFPEPAAFSLMEIMLWADYLGDTGLALEALRTGFEHFGVTGWMPWQGSLKHARSDPGFTDLMREYGFEDYWRATEEWGDFCRPLGEQDFVCDLIPGA